MKRMMWLVALISVGLLFSCEEPVQNAMDRNMAAKDDSLDAIVTKVPTPKVTTAQERKLVAKRVERFDVENKLGYVYIFIAGSATPMGYYTCIGKVASLNSYLVPQQKIVDRYQGRSYDQTNALVWRSMTPMLVEDADLDGTYGSNIEGVFFFTDNDVYVEIPVGGPIGYFYTDEPLPIKVPKLNK